MFLLIPKHTSQSISTSQCMSQHAYFGAPERLICYAFPTEHLAEMVGKAGNGYASVLAFPLLAQSSKYKKRGGYLEFTLEC